MSGDFTRHEGAPSESCSKVERSLRNQYDIPHDQELLRFKEICFLSEEIQDLRIGLSILSNYFEKKFFSLFNR